MSKQRILIISAFLLGLLALLVVAYKILPKNTGAEIQAIDAIPHSSTLLLKSNNAQATWRKISETNIIWEEFMSTHSAQHLDTLFSSVDSALQKEPDLQKLLTNNPFWLSFHLNKENQLGFLFSVKTGEKIKESQFDQFFNQLSSKGFQEEEFQNATLFSTSDFSYAFHQELLLMSTHKEILEESINHLNTAPSVLQNEDFQEVWATKGKFADANIFVNYKEFPRLLNRLVKSPFHKVIQQLSIFSSWSELDVSIKPNSISLNGFTYSNDSVFSFINAFADQKAEHHDVIKVLPSNTATFLHFGMSNFKGLMENYQRFLATEEGLANYQKNIQSINEQFNIRIENHLFSWIENEVALAVVEPLTSEIKEESYLILKTNNRENAERKLNEVFSQLSLIDSLEIDSSRHKGFAIRQLPIPNLFGEIFGTFFSSVQENYFTEIENYYVFGNSPDAIKSIINSYLSERTLAKDENFIAYSENLSQKSNILLYSNIARSVYMYERFTNQRLTQEIDQHLDLYRKFEAFSAQISREEDNLFYHNFFLKHNPVYKKEFSSLWEVALNADAHFKPAIVKNHYTQASEIFVQDTENTIYLISTTGKILWKRQLEEPIVSDIEQIDIFKNDKLQLVFNTANRLYIIDRLGRDVSGFPIQFPRSASAPLKILDYNNSKDYRFLVPAENGLIYNFDKKGKEVKGWKFERKNHPITHPIHYFVLNKKDYIVVVDNQGKAFALDRRGRVRLELKKPFAIRPNSDFYIEMGRTIQQTKLLGTDANGNVISLYFDGDSESMSFHPFSPNHQFAFADIDNDAIMDYIFVDQQQLEVYNTEKSALFKVKLDSTITAGPHIYSFSNSTRIGVSSATKDEIYLYDKKGNLSKNFPMFGKSPFSIADINKDNLYELVVCGKGGFVYVYTLE